MIKALVKLARGSGLHKTYGRILELRRDANLSMSKLPERLFVHSMKSLLQQRPFIQHSECSGFLVSLNIVRPGIALVLSLILRLDQHSRLNVSKLLRYVLALYIGLSTSCSAAF